MPYPQETEDKFLIDSDGNIINVKVTELHLLIARKIKTLKDSEGKNTGRLTKPQDFSELRRLIALERFKKSEAIAKLSHIYQVEENLSAEQAHKKANETIKEISGTIGVV